MTNFYYHCTNKEAIAKVAALQAERSRIHTKVRIYCQQFATEEHPIQKINFYAEHYHFAGIVFAKEMPRASWCAPTGKGHQSPRSKLGLKGATAEQKAAHADLLKRWEEIPKDSVDMNQVFVALIGVGNDFMFTGSAKEAEDGSFWVSSNRPAKLVDGVEEVFGSVYDKAAREIDDFEKAQRLAEAEARKQAVWPEIKHKGIA